MFAVDLPQPSDLEITRLYGTTPDRPVSAKSRAAWKGVIMPRKIQRALVHMEMSRDSGRADALLRRFD